MIRVGHTRPAPTSQETHTRNVLSLSNACSARRTRRPQATCTTSPATCCASVAEEAEPDALAYLAFPPSHWKRLRTNNVQERANREIKRRSRVVQVFPSERLLERLVGAVMCELDEQ